MLKPLFYPAVTVLAFLILVLPYILFIHERTGIWTFVPRYIVEEQVVEASQPPDDVPKTQQTVYRPKSIIGLMDPVLIKQSIRPWILHLVKINFHALAPLALLWIIFPFLSSRKLFANWRLDARNVRTALSFVIFSSPFLIYLTLLVQDRYLMPYSLYILIFLAFLIDRFLVRLLESLETERFGLGAILVCVVSLFAMSGYGSWVSPWVSPSLYKTLTERHGYSGIRAAGFWLRDHVQHADNLTIVAPRKGNVALFYATGKMEPVGEYYSRATPDMTLQEVAALVNSGEDHYLLLDNYYIDRRPQLIPLWDNPGLAHEYGLFLVYRDRNGLFQIYAGDREQ